LTTYTASNARASLSLENFSAAFHNQRLGIPKTFQTITCLCTLRSNYFLAQKKAQEMTDIPTSKKKFGQPKLAKIKKG